MRVADRGGLGSKTGAYFGRATPRERPYTMKFLTERLGLFIAAAVVLARLLVLDIDPPVRDLTDYLAKDECFYVQAAYDLYENGRAFEQTGPSWFGQPAVTNVVAYASLNLFGDNYYGLRSGSVLLSLLCLLLMHVQLRRITSDPWLLHLPPVILATDLSFGWAGIIVEPTMGRMAMMLLVMWMVIRVLANGRPSNARVVLLGVLATGLSLPTYPTNAFVVPATWSALVLSSGLPFHRWRSHASTTLLFAFGAMLAMAAIVGISHLLGGSDVAGFSTTKGNFASRVAVLPSGWLFNILHITSGNLFRLNPSLLLLWLTSLVMLFVVPMRRWKPVVIVVCSFTLFLLAQTVLINDYPHRKLVILLPLVLLAIAAAYEHAGEWTVSVTTRGPLRTAIVFLLLFVVLWSTWMQVSPSPFETTSVRRAFWPGIIVLLAFVGAMMFLGTHHPEKWFRHRWLLVLLLVPGVINSVRTMVVEGTHNYRDLSIDLREFDHKSFIGAASLGFRVNNAIQVEFSPYLVAGGYINSWPELSRRAHADTTTNYSIGYFDQRKEFANIGFDPIRVMVMNPEETWRERQFILYRERERISKDK